MKNIGLFGGTFNPIHIGHLRTVREVQEGFGLEKVYFIPSALPPHKSGDDIADVKERLEMARLAVSDCPEFIVSDVELKREGLSYTIDTVSYFKSVFSKDTLIYLILGFDAFLEINLWKSYNELMNLIPFIVMARPGVISPVVSSHNRNNEDFQQKLGNFLTSEISAGYKYCASQKCYTHPEKPSVFIFKVTSLDISATRIRKLISSGKSVQFLVPEKVEKFIQNKGLFL